MNHLSDKGFVNPDGLFVFTGRGRDNLGERPWSVVLKILKNPGGVAEEGSHSYWKRELLVNQSGLLASMPETIKAPRCYGTVEYSDGAWIWMEFIVSMESEHWDIQQWAAVARKIGLFNGAYLLGTPLPQYSWFSKDLVRGRIMGCHPEGAQWDALQGWENPYVKQHISAHLKERVTQLWIDSERFLSTLEVLPRTFAHLDLKRRNLFIRKRADGQDEVVAIDWAMCGIGFLGEDIATLIGVTARFLSWDPSAIQVLENAVTEPYITGLHEAGWRGNPDLIRLGCDIWYAMCLGVMAPSVIAIFTTEEKRSTILQIFGCQPDQLATAWATLCEFAVDRADEARRLMTHLQLG